MYIPPPSSCAALSQYQDFSRQARKTKCKRPSAHRPLACRADEEVAEALNTKQLGVIVFLDGHNSASRISILAHSPAPVQVFVCVHV